MLPKVFEFKLSFIKKEKIAADVYSFYFNKPADFSFLPGQYIRLTIPHADADTRGSSRFFTVSSSPLDAYLMITTRIYTDKRRNSSSFKQTLFQLTKDQEVTAFGPLGILYLEEKDAREKVFLSQGLGITPFYSMLRYAAQQKLSQSLTLIASFHHVDSYLFEDILQEITAANMASNVHFTTHLQPVELLGTELPLNKEAYYMITGAPHFVELTRDAVEQLHIDPTHILTEEFTGY